MSVIDRLEQRIMRDPNSGCWIWTGTLNPYGYGVIVVGKKNKQAHRLMFELARGPIPDGLVIDHLCRNRCCVNPQHLEPVSAAENTRRARIAGRPEDTRFDDSVCKYGHRLTQDNIFVGKNGYPVCKACKRLAQHKTRARRQAYRAEFQAQLSAKSSETPKQVGRSKVLAFVDSKGRRISGQSLL